MGTDSSLGPHGIRKQPTYMRSSLSTIQHPTQIARAKLHNTHGSVFLPLCPDLPALENPARTSPYSFLGSGTSCRSFSHLNVGSCLNNNTNNEAQAPKSPSILENNYDEHEPLITPDTSQQWSKEPDIELKIDIVPDVFHNEASQQAGAANIDGTIDSLLEIETSLKRRHSSLNDTYCRPKRLLNVHFSSLEHLRDISGNHRNRRDTVFTNPFGDDSEENSRRTSTSSSLSVYLRPNAFLGHRDTFVRYSRSAVDEVISETESECYNRSMEFSDRPSTEQLTFLGHRDTLARLVFRKNFSGTLPASVLTRILAYCSFDDYKHLRLVCKLWFSYLPRPIFPASFKIPMEILLEIYSYLNPCDFDAARHACKKWYLASLDYQTSCVMLRAARCYSAFVRDIEHQKVLHGALFHRGKRCAVSRMNPSVTDDAGPASDDQEWIISKRLATESRLIASRQGSNTKRLKGDNLARLTATHKVDFCEILWRGSQSTEITPPKFTVSECNKFVLVIDGRNVYVYYLYRPNSPLEPVTRLVADRDVLGVSMDTSSNYFTIAVLLDGRTGALWNISENIIEPHFRETLSTASVSTALPISEILLSVVSIQSNVEASTNIHCNQPLCATKSLGSSTRSFNPDFSCEALSPTETSKVFCTSIHIQPEVSALFSNLGSPTISVATCPQRSCVAHGFRAGVELHWVDILTGSFVKRCFPLIAPSDHLYFLPQRSDLQSTKKLRLISSASSSALEPSVRNAIPFTSGVHPGSRAQSMTRLFFGSLPFPASSLSGPCTEQYSDQNGSEQYRVLRTVDCDHYQAISLSDGVHVLFTDPVSRSLCLGADAPLGSATKLTQKICLLPPAAGQSYPPNEPCRYRAGSDLRWGFRIVAAYKNGDIVLYNVPIDHFEQIRCESPSLDLWDELAGVLGQSDLVMDEIMANQEMVSADIPSKGNRSDTPNGFNPLYLEGAVILRNSSITDDIQVDCTCGGLRVWIFGGDGHAIKMNIYTPENYQCQQLSIKADGSIRKV